MILSQMMQYIIERSQEFTTALTQHLYLTFLSLGISLVLGLGFGILATRIARLRKLLMFSANIGRTIPSLAILALALPLLGIGTPPTILALVLIGTLPILVNTTVGIEQVDDNMKESARGMGMTDFQILTKVELPVAVSIIMAGIRTAAVLLVASATLAAFIGAGGLGDLILRGHALSKNYIILAGAIPATLLAFYFEETFGRLEKWATPVGLKIGSPGFQLSQASLYELFSAVFVMPLIFGVLSPWVGFTTADGTHSILTGLHPQYQLLASITLILGIIGALFVSPKKPETAQRVLWSKTVIQSIAFLLTVLLLFQVLFASPANYSVRAGAFIFTAAELVLLVLALIELISTRKTIDEQGKTLLKGGEAVGKSTAVIS
jgi:osmoprotectant transport system permease protein